MRVQINERFYVDIDKYNHTLMETYTGKDRQGNSKEQTQTHGYFRDLTGAISYIIRLQEADGEEIIELKEYIGKIRMFARELKSDIDKMSRSIESR